MSVGGKRGTGNIQSFGRGEPCRMTTRVNGDIGYLECPDYYCSFFVFYLALRLSDALLIEKHEPTPNIVPAARRTCLIEEITHYRT